MILQALTDCYEMLALQHRVETPGWGMGKVSYAFELSKEGRVIGVIPQMERVTQGKKEVLRPQSLRIPEPLTRQSGILPNFLCDNSTYIMGVDTKGKPERTQSCFEASRDKHLKILDSCNSDAAIAVKNYFTIWKPEEAASQEVFEEVWDGLIAGVNIIFHYDGYAVQEDPAIQEVWQRYYSSAKDGIHGICLVTGQEDTIARTHTAIRGVPGAQSSGAQLISYNAPAFESYGKEQSYNASVGEKATYAYTTALNYLVSDFKHRDTLGDGVLVTYWAKHGETKYQNCFSMIMGAQPEESTQTTLTGLFHNLSAGKEIAIQDMGELQLNEPFYILGIGPNAARLSVRFFYQNNFGMILKNVAKHYSDMEIKNAGNSTNPYLGVWGMLREVENKKAKEKAPGNMVAAVYKAILSGSPYPTMLYSTVLRRIKADQDDSDRGIRKITAGRAAIIKAYLLRNKKGDISVELNENNHNVAYILGREFAVLEAIQQSANPGINTTIKDRYFNAACATPATIFPILFRLKNSHIKKISNVGLAISFEKKLGELQAKIMLDDTQNLAYPKRLSLEEQGMFILGYYHQTQKRYEKKEEK